MESLPVEMESLPAEMRSLPVELSGADKPPKTYQSIQDYLGLEIENRIRGWDGKWDRREQI